MGFAHATSEIRNMKSDQISAFQIYSSSVECWFSIDEAI